MLRSMQVALLSFSHYLRVSLLHRTLVRPTEQGQNNMAQALEVCQMGDPERQHYDSTSEGPQSYHSTQRSFS